MCVRPAPASVDRTLARTLRILAVQLVLATALVHAVYALARLPLYTPGALAVYAERGVLPPPRPALFVLASAAAVAGVLATWRGWLALRTAYGLGVALMATLVLAWVGWHTTLDHGAALAGGATAGPAHHHGGPVRTALAHYVDPLVAVVRGAGGRGGATALGGVVATVLEVAAIVVLGALLRGDPAIDRE